MIQAWKNYWAAGKLGFKVGLQYRLNFIVTMLTTPLSLLIYFFLWKSIYSATGQAVIRGFTFDALIGYYVLSMIMGFFTWCEVDKWMSQDVRRGHLVTIFVVPMSFLSQYLAFEIGINSLAIFLEMIPVLLIGFVIFGLHAAPLFNFIMFFVSIALAFILTFFISFNVGLGSFWLKRIDGLRRIRRTLIYFLSGGLIPLSFFPGWVQDVSHFLPFEYMRSVPIKIYLADYTVMGVFSQIGLQIVWIVLLYLFSAVVYRRAVRQFTGAGV